MSFITSIIFKQRLKKAGIGIHSPKTFGRHTVVEIESPFHCGTSEIAPVPLPDGRIPRIGAHTYLRSNVQLLSFESIGRYCSIARGVIIGPPNHAITGISTHPDFGFDCPHHKTPPVIGNDVWIGNNAIIMRGVTIGDGAVIAAGAVVTRDVQPYEIVAGVPAKPIRKRLSDPLIAACLELRWWNADPLILKTMPHSDPEQFLAEFRRINPPVSIPPLFRIDVAKRRLIRITCQEQTSRPTHLTRPAHTLGGSQNDFAPFEFRGCHSGIDLWLAKECAVSPEVLGQAIFAGLNDRAGALKYDSQRCVFAFGNIIIKTNLMPRLKDRLRPWRFAPAEFTSHLVVQESGIPCPRLLGAFRCTTSGLASFDGLLIERLEGYREISSENIIAGVEMACRLFQSGIYHPDFMRRNLMINDVDNSLKLIDMEGCKRTEPFSLPSLLMLVQRFIEYNELGAEHPLSCSFISEVYKRSGIGDRLDFATFRKAVDIMLSRHRSRKERRTLTLPDEVLNMLPPSNG